MADDGQLKPIGAHRNDASVDMKEEKAEQMHTGDTGQETMKPAVESAPATEKDLSDLEFAGGKKKGINVKSWFGGLWRDNFMARICRTVGMKYVIINLIMYGLDQGSIHSFNELGRVYYYKYRGFSPAETQRAIAWTDMVKSKSL